MSISNRVSSLRHSIRASVRRYGRTKTRARCKFYLQSLMVSTSASDDKYIEDYKKACRDVLGGEW